MLVDWLLKKNYKLRYKEKGGNSAKKWVNASFFSFKILQIALPVASMFAEEIKLMRGGDDVTYDEIRWAAVSFFS